jgi:hypothetical protein
MSYEDKNKKRREAQRRYLQRNGWVAVDGYTKSMAFRWKWIKPGVYKKAYTREDAVRMQKRRDAKEKSTV